MELFISVLLHREAIHASVSSRRFVFKITVTTNGPDTSNYLSLGWYCLRPAGSLRPIRQYCSLSGVRFHAASLRPRWHYNSVPARAHKRTIVAAQRHYSMNQYTGLYWLRNAVIFGWNRAKFEFARATRLSNGRASVFVRVKRIPETTLKEQGAPGHFLSWPVTSYT